MKCGNNNQPLDQKREEADSAFSKKITSWNISENSQENVRVGDLF